MKKVFFICISIMLFVTGCSNAFNEEKANELITKFHCDEDNFTESDANEMVKQLEALDNKIIPIIQDIRKNGADRRSELNPLMEIRYYLEQITQLKLAEEYPDVAKKSEELSIKYAKEVNNM